MLGSRFGKVYGLGYRLLGSGSGNIVCSLGFRVQGVGFRVR